MTEIGTSVLLDIAMAVLAATMAVLFWRKGTKQFRLHFVLISILVLVLAVSYMCELFSGGLEDKLLWNDVEYVSIVVVPVIYFLIIVKYAGREDLLSRRNLLLISIIPIFSLLMVWMNGTFHLFYQSVEISPVAFQTYLSVKGPAYFLHLIFSLVLTTCAIGIVTVAFIRSPKVHRNQIGLISLSALIPTAFIASVSLVPSLPISITDGMIVAFILSSMVLYLAIFRFGLFYATPLVLSSIADLMRDGTIMLNKDDQIIYLNSTASNLSQREAGFPLGRPIGEVFPSIQAAIGKEGEGLKTIEMVGTDGQPLRLEACISTVRSGKKEVGRLVILRDLSSLRRSEEALATLNNKMNVLCSVTRHDILNRTSVIHGYGELLKDDMDSVRSDDYLKRMLESTRAIEHIITFTKEYEKVGAASPEWQDIARIYLRAKVLCAEHGVEYIIATGNIEVYADPMLERLFYILLDNSYKHGRNISRISISTITYAQECLIVYEDDGVGVRDEEKEVIFEKGYGKDSGLGLYLGRQILGITGIGIRENGMASKGARFEILVPKGMWRYVGGSDVSAPSGNGGTSEPSLA